MEIRERRKGPKKDLVSLISKRRTIKMDLENIMLSEISQSEKAKNHMISLICET